MLRRVEQKLGFTIVELMVIIIVIGILAAMGAMYWHGVQERAFNSRIQHDMTTYESAFKLYASQEKEYPAVPALGRYCLGTSGLTGAEVNATTGSSLPTSTTAGGVTATSYFCRDLSSVATRHAAYPPLSRDLASVASVSQGSDHAKYLVDHDTGGVFVDYSGSASATTIGIFGFIKGTDCPSGTLPEWADPSGSKALCKIILDKTYPADYTGEAWPYAR